jgi:hypothetical protein
VALQFGETQWWYFPNDSGMPYYDAETKREFEVPEHGAHDQLFDDSLRAKREHGSSFGLK